jgi:IS6 family transposase
MVLPFGFASSLQRETRLQDWTHRYALNYRDLEEMMQEQGVEVDHSTNNHWVLKYAPELDKRIRRHLKQ